MFPSILSHDMYLVAIESGYVKGSIRFHDPVKKHVVILGKDVQVRGNIENATILRTQV